MQATVQVQAGQATKTQETVSDVRGETEKAAEAERARLEHERAQSGERLREEVKNAVADLKYLEEKFEIYCRREHMLPPELLPLEEAEEVAPFIKYITSISMRAINARAIRLFRERVLLRAQHARAAFSAFEKLMRRKPLWPFGKVARLLRRCKVSVRSPDLDSPVKQAIAATQQYVRTRWSTRLDRKDQAVFTVHYSRNQTVVHIASGEHGSLFVTVDAELNPVEVAHEFLKKLGEPSAKFINSDGVISVIDGAHQSFNPKKIFKKAIAVRSVTDDVVTFARNLDEILQRDPPVPGNSSLHLGVPASRAELAAVFRGGTPDWEVWDGVQANWSRRAADGGFPTDLAASREAVLRSLATSKNVIIVVAHSDGERVFLPAPIPEGSVVSAKDVRDYEAEIRKNQPIVYLFCCETAAISNMANFSRILVESGAVGVVAPQTRIDAHLSSELFQQFIAPSEKGRSALNVLRDAEGRTGYREMEVWVA